jgi:hypothetical protein
LIGLPLWKKLKKNSRKQKRITDGTERDVKERYENFIHIIKGKLEEPTTKRKNENNLGNGRQGKWEVKINNQSVYGGTENAIR